MIRLRRPRQSRAVTVTYGGVAMAILLVVAVVALVVAPPAPPSVAEFAPQAADTIDESPDNQSSRFGAGDGACAEGQVCQATTTTVPGDEDGDGVRDDRSDRVIDVKRVRRCVGDPPRQTEDPQSPPCVNYFEGDNGGTTAFGVTRDEIRIGVPGFRAALFDAFLPHFNDRYEFYGRKLRLVNTEAEGRYAAVSAKEQGAFAAVHPEFSGNVYADSGFMQEAARLGVVAVTAATTADQHQADLQSAAPYGWTFRQPGDVLQRAMGTFACSSLAGRQARYAGGNYRLAQRRFAILIPERGDRSRMTRAVEQALARCHASARVYESAGSHEDVAGMQRLQGDGITTVLSIDTPFRLKNVMIAASKIGYEPEWVHLGIGAEDELQWATGPPQQRAHLMALAPFNKILPATDEPSTWALRETGKAVGDAQPQDVVAAYQSLLLLASGIQLAGPDLRPDSFARGLQAARFPNPGHGASPFFQAHVGFAPGDFTMMDDVAVVWWSDAAPSYRNGVGGTGGWCYVGRGGRFGPTAIPDVESALFDPDPGACR
jgi:hypothetical protein